MDNEKRFHGTTGVVRAMDRLGRAVIPMEMRRELGIVPGSKLEMSIENGCVVLRPHPIQSACNDVSADLIRILFQQTNVILYVTGMNAVTFRLDLSDPGRPKPVFDARIPLSGEAATMIAGGEAWSADSLSDVVRLTEGGAILASALAPIRNRSGLVVGAVAAMAGRGSLEDASLCAGIAAAFVERQIDMRG